jgi:predicted RNA binding protein YcfA (HicA-like mRNA interferase family)
MGREGVNSEFCYNDGMSKRQKRLERIRQNPNNVALADLRHVLEDYGFQYLRTVGSHYTFSYELGGKTHLFVVPFKRPVKPIYVKRALKIIDQIIEEQGEDEPDERDDQDS